MTSFYNRAAAMEFAGEFWNRPCRSDTQPFALGMDGGRDVPLSARFGISARRRASITNRASCTAPCGGRTS